MLRSTTFAVFCLCGIVLLSASPAAQAQPLVGEGKVYLRPDKAPMFVRINVQPSSGLQNYGGLLPSPF